MVKEFDRDEYISECYAQGMDKCVVKKQEPVAWTDGKFCLSFAESDVCPMPLYTAPRELSDDEILSLVPNQDVWKYEIADERIIEFARAVLKKVNENE